MTDFPFPSTTINAFKGAYNLGIFFRLETSPALHLWWGVHNVPAQLDSLDVSGTVYRGCCTMTQIPQALEILMNGSADKAVFSLNGVDPTLTVNLLDTAPSVVGKRVVIAIAPFTQRWMLGDVLTPMWVGTSDIWSMAMPPEPDQEKARTQTLTLSVTAGDNNRALPFYATWTDRDQRRIASDDTFCSRTPRYYPGLSITWPRF